MPPESIPTGEQLLDRASRPYLAWVPAGKSIVLGNSQDAEKELNVENVRQDGVPVFKRMSGGGAVLLSPGCVCVGLRFAKDPALSIHDYFAQGSAVISEVAAEKLGLELRLRGTSDLACLGPLGMSASLGEKLAESAGNSNSPEGTLERKVAGCALYMPRDFVLYLVSILVDPDFGDMEKYLAHPSKEPGYRGGRTHRDFLAGLGPLSGKPLQPADMAAWLQQKIPASPGLVLDWELCRDR
ncbi:MAG: putative lipoate-protein ligase [Fibrobacteres bacterium]|nr:putative lipoate-protein ligase [Fibrobacterota bacterium]